MRRILLVLLGFGVFAGYGSAIASARWHHRNAGGGCEGRWSENRWHRGDRDQARAAPVPAASPAVSTVVVPPAAAAPAPVAGQQIFLIMPGAQATPGAPQVITVPVPAAQAPAPPAVTP